MDNPKYPWMIQGKPKQKARAKEIMGEFLLYLFPDEIEAGRPDVSRDDDLMDTRGAWVALNDEDYDRALELASFIDGDLEEDIRKMIRMRS